MKKLNTQEFIQKSIEIHGDKYDYSVSNYDGNRKEIEIICPIHGTFKQIAGTHLNGSGCLKCSDTRKTKEKFIQESSIIHNNKYDYSLVYYINAHTNVKIICPEHGIFEQTPNVHLTKKCGCKKCSDFKQTLKNFIEKSNKIHNNKYDYSLVEYINAYNQKPSNHMNMGQSCPECKETISKGERNIIKILTDKEINFIKQKTFEECKDIRKLPFDFYLPDYNICIEFDGRQHFESVKYWNGEEGLLRLQKHDKIKTDYCLNNNIKLIRISYKEKEDINRIINDLYTKMKKD